MKRRSVFTAISFYYKVFEDVLCESSFGADYELKNRYIHVDYVDEYVPQSIKAKDSKYQFDTLDCSLEELAILKLIAKNPTVKQQELVNATGKSIATVKRIMKSLREKNYIRRENGKRYGKWEMLI